MPKLNPSDFCLNLHPKPAPGYRSVWVGYDRVRALFLAGTDENDIVNSWTTDIRRARLFGNSGHPFYKARRACLSDAKDVRLNGCGSICFGLHEAVLEPWYEDKGQYTLPAVLTVGAVLNTETYRAFLSEITSAGHSWSDEYLTGAIEECCLG